MTSANHWIEKVIKMAEENAAKGEGPFAAIVVRDGEVVGTGVNSVGSKKDPTAHAELSAIRDACTRLQTIDLSDCDLYASGEPCPMCMGAIYWAKPRAVYYACSKAAAAAEVGFTDPLAHFYQDMAHSAKERTILVSEVDSPRKLEPFHIWTRQNG